MLQWLCYNDYATIKRVSESNCFSIPIHSASHSNWEVLTQIWWTPKIEVENVSLAREWRRLTMAEESRKYDVRLSTRRTVEDRSESSDAPDGWVWRPSQLHLPQLAPSCTEHTRVTAGRVEDRPLNVQYNSSNGMYISQTFFGGDTPDPQLRVYSIQDGNKRLVNNLCTSFKVDL